MKSPHPAFIPVEELIKQCKFTRTRRGGPGGQHRNKVETGVFLCHRASRIEAAATEKRNQAENRSIAIVRLRRNLAVQLRLPAEQRDVSERWVKRLKGTRIECSAAHAEFPALLAEALDFLAAERWEYPKAAARLRCSGTQLLKFIKKEPAAWEVFNQGRVAAGLPRLSY